MFEALPFIILVILSLLGGVIVPVLMGTFVWIERREHRIRLAGVLPGDWWIRQRLVAINRERIAGFEPRHMQWMDLVGVWPIVVFAIILLMPLASWFSQFGDDFLFTVHPVVCVGWWLNMRSRGIIRAEVYAVAVWILAHTAWSLSMLAPLAESAWGRDRFNGGMTSFVADRLGVSSDLALTLWLLYVASGMVCALAGTVLARAERPSFSPLLAVTLWIPLVWVALNTNLYFGYLGLLTSVGVAGYGISREFRRNRDDAETRAGNSVCDSPPTLRWKTSKGLILRTSAVIVVAVVIWVSVRELRMSNLAAELIATLAVLVLVPTVTALLAHIDSRPRIASAWAAWSWMATVSLLASYHLIGPSSSLFIELSRGYGPAYRDTSIDLLIHPQAIAVWLVAVASFVIAYRTARLMSYGALMLGLLWFPIATFAASLQYSRNTFYPYPDPVGYASMVAMGCVTLVIMWRFFGPGATAAVVARQSSEVPADNPGAPGTRANAGYPTRVRLHQGTKPEVIPMPQRSPDSELRA